MFCDMERLRQVTELLPDEPERDLLLSQISVDGLIVSPTCTSDRFVIDEVRFLKALRLFQLSGRDFGNWAD